MTAAPVSSSEGTSSSTIAVAATLAVVAALALASAVYLFVQLSKTKRKLQGALANGSGPGE